MWIIAGNKNKVYKLEKAIIWRLKQIPKAQYSHIDAYFEKEGFRKYPYEHTLFTKIKDGKKMLIICVYVDDLICIGNNISMIEKIEQFMISESDMSNLGIMH